MKRIVVFWVFVFLFNYCKSDSVEPIPSYDGVKDYYPLTIGNYWIYNLYSADSTLNFTKMSETDSIFVQKDSVVKGIVYKVVKSKWLGETLLLRDSSNYIVASNGTKLLTTVPNTGILNQSIIPAGNISFKVTFKMKAQDSTCTVPLGNFLSKYVDGTLSPTTSNSSYKDRRLFYAYSKGVGMVSRRLAYVISNQYVEERLVRYKIIK